MPKKKLYLQISFEQGMIDTIVSDYDYQDSDLKWQAPQSRSALYIENYDPTIVKGALTKRYGYGMMRVAGYEIQGRTGLVNWADREPFTFYPYSKGYNFAFVSYDVNKFTNWIDNDPNPAEVGGPAYSSSQDGITVCGATVVPYNKPYGQNVLVMFIRDIVDDTEHTRIVHYGAHISDEAVPKWRNSLINGDDLAGRVNQGGTVSPSVYPGWDIRGTFTDAARHGGTLIVTSNVAKEYRPWSVSFDWTQDWIESMYPCYVWTYWDLRRKRYNRKYWQVISDGVTTVTALADLSENYTADDKYSQFKVMYPSQYLTRNESLASWRAYTTNSVIVNASAADGGDLSLAVATDNAAHNVLNIGPQNNSIVEVSIVEARGRSFSSTPQQWISDSNPDDDRLAVESEYVMLNNYSSHIRTLEIPKNYTIARASNEYWATAVRKTRAGKQVENIDIQKGTLSISASRKKTTEIIGKPLLDPNDTDRYLGNGYYDDKDDENFKKIEDPIIWVVPISLPNYLENNCPRPWLKGEKIPLLLTATVRGAEVLLSEHVHTVTGNDYLPYPSMYWPSGTGGIPSTLVNGASVDTTISSLTFGNGSTQFRDKSYVNYYGNGPHPHGNAVAEQYYLLRDSQVRFNGRLVLSCMNSGFALQIGPVVAGTPAPVRYKLYDSYQPYCIEPFNPTQNAPFVAAPFEYAAIAPIPPWDAADVVNLFHRPTPMSTAALAVTTNLLFQTPTQADNDAVVGYRREHTNPRLIYVTIKIAKDKIDGLLDMGVEALNLYAAQPSDESALKSVGLYNVEDPTAGVYMLPDEPGDDYVKYRLVKKFVLDGDGEPFHNYRTSNEKDYWKANYYGTPVATNSWVEKDTFLIATGQHKTEVSGSNAGLQLTPDFILWDYPVSTTLNLNSSGKYWQGRGASIVTNIKGRTFIGGCIDQFGEEEQSIVRYSDVQSGIVTLDLFSEENFIRVGGLPHTAMCEYREQLWVFSRTEVHRIQMPDIVNTSSWEYLDKTPGQGTFNNKTYITMPQGVAWCNESGVWLSDGRIPQNLAEPVLTFYKAMATNSPPYYSTKINLPQFPVSQEGYNPYLELSYDEQRNELVVSSPSTLKSGFNDFSGKSYDVPVEEWRLVYSVAQTTWRIEHADEPPFDTLLNEFDQQGKVTFEL